MLSHDFNDCRRCGKCEEVCPNKFEIIKEMESYDNKIREFRGRVAISYGKTFIAQKGTRVATIPIGYADGLSRLLSNKGIVIIRNCIAPIIGRVCMDQCLINVTHIPEVWADDEVIIFGSSEDQAITVDDIAKLCNTINYEVVSVISPRVPRYYISKGNISGPSF